MDNCYSDFINMNEMELSRALSKQKSKKNQSKQNRKQGLNLQRKPSLRSL